MKLSDPYGSTSCIPLEVPRYSSTRVLRCTPGTKVLSTSSPGIEVLNLVCIIFPLDVHTHASVTARHDDGPWIATCMSEQEESIQKFIRTKYY